MNCILETFAGLWIRTLYAVSSKALESDLTMTAQQQLKDALTYMHDQISKSDTEIKKISDVVRTERHKMPKERLKTLLLKSKRTRAAQSSMLSKITLMEGQLEAMENNEMNKTILNTLQTSAKAMKKMGLDKDLHKTDNVISELEENMQHAQDINNTVSSSVNQSDYANDDDALELELNLLLGIEEPPARPKAPTQYNTMQKQVHVSVTQKEEEEPIATEVTELQSKSLVTHNENNNNNDDGPFAPPERIQFVTLPKFVHSTHSLAFTLPSVPSEPVKINKARIQEITDDETSQKIEMAH